MTKKHEMRFDFDGLIQLLAKNLYSEKNVFIRELIQNGHDSIIRRRQVEAGFGGRIDVETRPYDLLFIVRDNGIGMNESDLVEFLSTVGRGATRIEKNKAEDTGLIGQFGIGFLSAFVVAVEVEVLTRKLGETQGWRWRNTGSKDYDLEPHDVDMVGTTVTVKLKGVEEKGVIDEDEVKKTIRYYADMLQVPIHLNQSTVAINTMTMPWEKQDLSAKEIELDCYVYLEKHMRDSVLEVIPFHITEGVRASGVLYISKSRALGVEVPRNVKVFISRMFLCENAELLPKWAQFVNGIVNTDYLTPTAARDNFVRDKNHQELQEQLGNLVIQHLEKLHKEQPERFSQILRYHDLGIKAACHYYDAFFKKFVHLLEWRVNAKQSGKPSQMDDFGRVAVRMTLPEISKTLKGSSDTAKVLPYFADSNSANQYFDMADAANSLVVDASYHFEQQLLEEYARLDETNIKLVRVDREDDPNVFRKIVDVQEAARLQQLTEIMSDIIRPGGTQHIRVEAASFNPPSLAAVIRSTERSRAQSKADEMLNDPTVSKDLREMALELSKMARQSSLRLVINAENALVQRLAKQNLDKPSVELAQIMTGLYNNAILYNQELMTPDNARVFHTQLHDLLERSLDYIVEKSSLDQERQHLEREKAALHPQAERRANHKIFFLIVSYRPEYELLQQTLREVVEDKWGCQLFIATDKHYDQWVLNNIRLHINQADAFIAEITEETPNVMFELGLVFEMQLPIIALRDKSKEKPKEPADIRGFLYIDYGADTQGKSLADFLEEKMYNQQKIKHLLEDKARERYLSPSTLQQILGKFAPPPEVLKKLSERYPTQQAWQSAQAADIKTDLGADSDSADLIINRIKNNGKTA